MKTRIAIILLFLNSFFFTYGQTYTDEEIGFNRDSLRNELLKNNHFVNAQFIESYIDTLRVEVVKIHRDGFDNWLKTKINKNSNAINNTFSCNDFTFNDGINPLFNWKFCYNSNPFTYNDSFDEEIDSQILGYSHAFDMNDFFRFNIYNTSQDANDPYAEILGQFPNTNFIRIGNNQTHIRKEMISKPFILQDLDDLIAYDYAIVLQDPGHESRPFFSFNMLINGNVIDCSTVRYEATRNINGFNNFGYSNVKVKPWSMNVLRPSDFGANIGDEINIQVATSDCGAGGHFGYAYFDVKCLTESDLIIMDSENYCINKDIDIETIIDTSNSELLWQVLDNQNNIISTSNYNLFTYNFSNAGAYTIKLTINYFNTNNCDQKSVFVKNINVINCEPCTNCTSFDLLKGEKYIVSGWVKEDLYNNQTTSTYKNSNIKITFKDINGNNIGTPLKFEPSGSIIDGWQRIIGEFFVPSNIEDFYLELQNENANDFNSYFDDIRVLPTKSNMKSFVYDQETQRLMAELDENNYATFYEYDKEGGLVRVKKETERGVFTIQETRSNTRKSN